MLRKPAAWADCTPEQNRGRDCTKRRLCDLASPSASMSSGWRSPAFIKSIKQLFAALLCRGHHMVRIVSGYPALLLGLVKSRAHSMILRSRLCGPMTVCGTRSLHRSSWNLGPVAKLSPKIIVSMFFSIIPREYSRIPYPPTLGGVLDGFRRRRPEMGRAG